MHGQKNFRPVFVSSAHGQKPPLPSVTPAPWSCLHRADGSNLEAYSEACGDWIIVAKTLAAENTNHMANADMITRAINDYDLDKQLIGDLTSALELCLQCEGLSWEAEQEANIMVARAKLAVA